MPKAGSATNVDTPAPAEPSAKDKREMRAAKKLAKSIAIDLRVILQDQRRNLEEFEKYVDSWDEELAGDGLDPRALLQPFVIERAMDQVEGVTHIHTGSTDHSHFRTFRQRCLSALRGEDRY